MVPTTIALLIKAYFVILENGNNSRGWLNSHHPQPFHLQTSRPFWVHHWEESEYGESQMPFSPARFCSTPRL